MSAYNATKVGRDLAERDRRGGTRRHRHPGVGCHAGFFSTHLLETMRAPERNAHGTRIMSASGKDATAAARAILGQPPAATCTSSGRASTAGVAAEAAVSGVVRQAGRAADRLAPGAWGPPEDETRVDLRQALQQLRLASIALPSSARRNTAASDLERSSATGQ